MKKYINILQIIQYILIQSYINNNFKFTYNYIYIYEYIAFNKL